jgi:hypothetical protein
MAVTGDRTKIKLGPQEVWFGGTNLGFTAGGVEIIYTPTYREIMVDQLGTLVDVRLTKEDIEAKFTMSEMTRDKLLIAMPGASAASGAASAAGLNGGRIPGYSVAQNASGLLLLHPVGVASGDKTYDWTIFMAVNVGPINIPMKADEEQPVPMHFKGIADPAREDTTHLFKWGY